MLTEPNLPTVDTIPCPPPSHMEYDDFDLGSDWYDMDEETLTVPPVPAI